MSLHLLHASPSLHISRDTRHGWLYLDWRGALTRTTVQEGWLASCRCMLERSYSCVLTSKVQVTSVDWELAAWLLTGFERFLRLTGIEYVAWVHGPGMRGLTFAEGTTGPLQHLNVSVFTDVEQAVTWLSHVCPPVAPHVPPARYPAATLAHLQHLMASLERSLAAEAHFAEGPATRRAT